MLTPFLGALLLRDKVTPETWVAALLSVGGLAVLSLGGDGLGLGTGELFTLGCAAVYALHILGVGRATSAALATALSTVQMLAIAATSTVAASVDGIRLPQGSGQWWAVVYMAVCAGAVALWAQTWGQAHLSAARAAIVMTLEPVFAAAFAVLLGGEQVGWRMLLGGGLIMTAMYVVELAGRGGDTPALVDPPAEALHHEP